MRHALSAEELEVAAGLHPTFRRVVLRLRDACLDERLSAELVSGFRPRQFQAILYENPDLMVGGVRVRAAGVPAAKPGVSKHGVGFAADLGGPRTAEQQARFGQLAEAHGLEWGGRYGDPNHVESRTALVDLLAFLRVEVAE